jgi:hypothetical protein
MMLHQVTSEPLTEEQIEQLSKDECIRLRRQYQDQLANFYKTNPAILSRLVSKLNDRLFGHIELDVAEG